MKYRLKLGVVLSTCMALGGCEEMLIEPDVEITYAQSPDSVINGYFLSRVTVTDGNGIVTADAAISINTAGNGLSSTDYTVARLSPAQPNEFGLYKYDDNGNWTHHSLTTLDTDQPYERNFFYNSNGKLTSRLDTTHNGSQLEEVYSYNQQGQLSIRSRDTATVGDVGGERVWRYYYDASGNLESMTEDMPSVPGDGDVTYFYYNQNAQLIQSQFDRASDGSIELIREYRYNDEGNLSQELRYGSSGGFIGQTEYAYRATDEIVFNEMLFTMKYYPR